MDRTTGNGFRNSQPTIGYVCRICLRWLTLLGIVLESFQALSTQSYILLQLVT